MDRVVERLVANQRLSFLASSTHRALVGRGLSEVEGARHVGGAVEELAARVEQQQAGRVDGGVGLRRRTVVDDGAVGREAGDRFETGAAAGGLLQPVAQQDGAGLQLRPRLASRHLQRHATSGFP